MNLQQALQWADKNTDPKAVERLRSRAAVKVLANTVRTYADWIRAEGEMRNICTYNILGEVCVDCACLRNLCDTKGI